LTYDIVYVIFVITYTIFIKESRMTDMTDEELKERIKKLNRRLEEETNKSNPDKDLASMLKTDLINALKELVKRMESGWKRKNYN
tara:strand:- start:1 stop:255 length:255 start_codon:yes stop_codon:yes gene_type:complete